MAKPTFDQNALIEMFENATAKGSGQLRKAVADATLKALQGRELTLKNIRSALKSVSEAAGAGAAKNVAGIDVETLLDKAVSGMDDAVLKAVEANRAALQQFVSQGADLREKHLKKALDDLEKMEDTMFEAMSKAASGASVPVAGAWDQVMQKMQAAGTMSGSQASTTVEQMTAQMQTAVRDTRAASMRAMQAMAESYAALASGVLIGMSEAMQQGGVAKAPSPAPAPAKTAARRK
jgi:hypothetical protein